MMTMFWILLMLTIAAMTAVFLRAFDIWADNKIEQWRRNRECVCGMDTLPGSHSQSKCEFSEFDESLLYGKWVQR